MMRQQSGMMQRLAAVGVRAGRVLLGAGCGLWFSVAGLACHDPKCEAARIEIEQTWLTLRDTATSRKQIPEGLDLSQAEQQERIRVWTRIEDRTELLRSSFETKQVTWPSADKARADLSVAFTPIASNVDPMTRGFSQTLGQADQRMAEFRKTCR